MFHKGSQYCVQRWINEIKRETSLFVWPNDTKKRKGGETEEQTRIIN